MWKGSTALVGPAGALSSLQPIAVTSNITKARERDSTGFTFIFIFDLIWFNNDLGVKPSKMILDIALWSQPLGKRSEQWLLMG